MVNKYIYKCKRLLNVAAISLAAQKHLKRIVYGSCINQVCHPCYRWWYKKWLHDQVHNLPIGFTSDFCWIILCFVCPAACTMSWLSFPVFLSIQQDYYLFPYFSLTVKANKGKNTLSVQLFSEPKHNFVIKVITDCLTLFLKPSSLTGLSCCGSPGWFPGTLVT